MTTTNDKPLALLMSLLERAEGRERVLTDGEDGYEFDTLGDLGLISWDTVREDESQWLNLRLTDTGAALLAALRAADRVADVERERDEARAAVDALAMEAHDRCGNCIAFHDSPMSNIAEHGTHCGRPANGETCLQTRRRVAYASTGGTAPAEDGAQ